MQPRDIAEPGPTTSPERNTLLAEAQVLRVFADYDVTTMPTTVLFDRCAPLSHADVSRALMRLEDDRLVLRYTWDGNDYVTLTIRGVAKRGAAPAERRRERDVTSRPPQIIDEHPHPIDRNGVAYRAYVLGAQRQDGMWAGWIEFVPSTGGERLRTGTETTQPDLNAFAYWASGLEDTFFEGALDRAKAA